MTHKIKNLIKLLVENELSSLEKPEITVYFDMDGVLADFHGGLVHNKIVENSKKELDELFSQVPDLQGLPTDELREKFRGQQKDPVMAKLKKAWNKYRGLTYSFASQPGFFIGLEVLPGAKNMLNAAKNFTGKLPNILTAPIDSNPTCEKEKHEWADKNFKGMYNNFYCTQNKEKFANSRYDILIDDRLKFVNKFIANGGTTILHTSPEKSIKELEEIISDFSKINEISAIGVGTGAVQSSGKISGTGGNPLGGDMSGQYDILWSGNDEEK